MSPEPEFSGIEENSGKTSRESGQDEPENAVRGPCLWGAPGNPLPKSVSSVGPWRVSGGYRVRDVKGVDGKWRTSLEHREVMSGLLGRPLSKSEHVHHKDENRLNNDPSNLELLTHAEHTRRHFGTGRSVSERTCQGCGAAFSRDAKYKAARFCGRVCASKYAGKRSAEQRSGRAA